MRHAILPPILAWFFAACALPLAAQTAQTDALPAAPFVAEKTRPEPKVEQIHHQDKSVAIDEVRVGGQTQSIEVKPSNDKLRPYQAHPVRCF